MEASEIMEIATKQARLARGVTPQDREDLAQEAAVHCWSLVGRLEGPPERQRAFMRKAARNRIYGLLRLRSRRQPPSIPIVDEWTEEAPGIVRRDESDPESIVSADEVRREILRVLLDVYRNTSEAQRVYLRAALGWETDTSVLDEKTVAARVMVGQRVKRQIEKRLREANLDDSSITAAIAAVRGSGYHHRKWKAA